MSEFHYVRTRGSEGGVDACEGPAIGLDLETVLKDGLPPWNVALEIVAALCEVLDIADEDGEVHGDVHPKYVFIDETGAVSLEGFGVKRKKTRGPDDEPRETRNDLYGLGYTAFRCFCDVPFPDTAAATAPAAHDDLIVDAALAIDLAAVPPEMARDIQWYIAKLLSHSPADRPKALDAWRMFIAFANGWEGDVVETIEWCAAALDGGGIRRDAGAVGAIAIGDPGALPPSGRREEEELGGPVMKAGPLTSRFRFEEGAGKPGAGATAFWTKDDMKKALKAGSDLTPPGSDRAESSESAVAEASVETPSGAPRAGGGSATSFWTQSQLDAMARGDDNAPRPRRADGEGERRRVTAAQRPPVSEKPPEPPPRPAGNRPPLATGQPPPVRSESPSPVPSHPSHAPSPATQKAAKAASSAATVQYQLSAEEKARLDADDAARKAAKAAPVGKPAAASPQPPPPPPAEGGGVTVMLFGGGIAAVGLFVAAALVFVAAVILFVILWNREPPPPPALPIRSPTPVPTDVVEDDGVTDDALQPGTATPGPPPARERTSERVEPTPAPTGPAPADSARPTAPTAAPTAPTGSPKPAAGPPMVRPRPKPSADGSARVTVKSSGRASVTGCTPAKLDFEGMQALTIESYQLPATCLITIDGGKGVFQVYGSGDITCDKQGNAVLCDRNQVP